MIGGPEFEELFRATAKDIYRYVRRRTLGDAEDLVAEVYAVAWRRRADLPAPILRRAWLFGVARTLLLADGREAASRQRALQDVALRNAHALSAEDPASPEPSAVVRAALDRLPDAEREILRLVEWERLTTAELAVALGVRPGAARVRLHRARRALARDPDVQALVDGRCASRHVETSPTALASGFAEG